MIPIFDLTRQHQGIEKELMASFRSVVRGGVFVLGNEVASFEQEFSSYLGVSYAIGVASGTDAISLALLGLGVQPGDEVILPANSYPSVFGVTAVGAIPRLVDIDPETYTLDPDLLPAAITKKTKAILSVHLYGRPADMESILAIGKGERIPVIEDCAQAAGGVVRSKGKVGGSKEEKRNAHTTNYILHTTKLGTLGDIGCFSFYPTKNLGCLGDGGMVVTDDPDIADRVRRLRMYGEKERYVSTVIGRNSRLDEIQAAFLRIKLPYLDEWNKRRREIASVYTKCSMEHVVGSKEEENKFSPTTNYQLLTTMDHVYHLYVIRCDERERLRSYLEEKGVGTGIHYPTPIHLVPSMKYLGYKKGDFPQSEKACEEVLSLPMYPELTNKEVEYISSCLNTFK